MGQTGTATGYPDFDALYYSYYLRGLYDAYGTRGVRFSARRLPAFSPSCLAFVDHV